MFSTALPSSSPSVDILFFLENFCINQLLSLQLSYRNIKYLLISQQISLNNYSGNFLLRPNLLLTPFDNFSVNFPILENIKEENQFDIDKEELLGEATANKAFLKENFDSDSNSESVNNSKPNQPKSNNLLSFKDSKTSICLKSLVAISSTSYPRKKLIKILNDDILIPK